MTGPIHTIGHSNRDTETLLGLLTAHGIDHIVDIRSSPRSRRHPHFNRDVMSAWLSANGIGTVWMGRALGGFRKPDPHSPHHALTESGFRGFADHMSTDTFRDAAISLRGLESNHVLALMCVEENPDSCHRQFIADYLTVNGVPVEHIRASGSSAHRPNPLLRVGNGVLTYDRLAQGTLF